MALCQVSKGPIWMVDFLHSLGVSLQGPMVVSADNQGSIALAKNPVFHDRSKHIDVQYHYTQDLVKERKIQLEYIPTSDMLAGLLTKPLPRSRTTCASLSGYWSVLNFGTLTRFAARGCVGDRYVARALASCVWRQAISVGNSIPYCDCCVP